MSVKEAEEWAKEKAPFIDEGAFEKELMGEVERLNEVPHRPRPDRIVVCLEPEVQAQLDRIERLLGLMGQA